MKVFPCLIHGDRSSFASIPPLSSVCLPSSLCGPGSSLGAKGEDPSLIPRCVMVLGENVLYLRSGLDQVSAPQRHMLPLD